MFTRFREDLPASTPGLDLLANSVAEAGVKPPVLLLLRAALSSRMCFPANWSRQSILATVRPAVFPGKQVSTSDLPQPGCVNDSSAPWLSRCFAARRKYVDIGAFGAAFGPSGRPEPTNYNVLALNTSLLCNALMPDDCLASLGPMGCFIFLFPRLRNPPPVDLQLLSSAPPAVGGQSSRPMGVIVAALLGAMAAVAILVVAAVATVVVRRRRRRGRKDPGAAGAGEEQLASEGPSRDKAVESGTFTPFAPTLGIELQWQQEVQQQQGSGSGGQGGGLCPAPHNVAARILANEADGTCSPSEAAGALVLQLHGSNPKGEGDPGAPSGTAAGGSRAALDPANGDLNGLLWDANPVTALTPPRTDMQLLPDPSGHHSNEVTLLPGATRGRGSFGRVVEGTYKGQRVAVKLVADAHQWGGPSASLMRSFIQEVEVLGRCRHPNIVRLLAACLQPPRVCLVMELMETSLEHLLYGEPQQLVPLPKVLHIALQIATGLAYLHPTIVHRDLKPGNVLLDDPHSSRPVVKITDFGLSRLRSTAVPTLTPNAGTPAYLAPEAYNTASGSIITHKADIYSLAVLLWEMLGGQRPWHGCAVMGVAFQVSMMGRRPPLDQLPSSRCPTKLRMLMRDCWDGDPSRRPAAVEVAKELALVLQEVTNNGAKGACRLCAPGLGFLPRPSFKQRLGGDGGGAGPRVLEQGPQAPLSSLDPATVAAIEFATRKVAPETIRSGLPAASLSCSDRRPSSSHVPLPPPRQQLPLSARPVGLMDIKLAMQQPAPAGVRPEGPNEVAAANPGGGGSSGGAVAAAGCGTASAGGAVSDVPCNLASLPSSAVVQVSFAGQ